MFLVIAVLFASVTALELGEPKFQLLGPNELRVKVVPQVEGVKLVTLRIGVRRSGSVFEDLERGENVIENGYVYFNDKRLALRKGDVVNYLLGVRDDKGYHAKTGSYVFDGVYAKAPLRRRRRDIISTTTEDSQVTELQGTTTDGDFEGIEIESRFGGGYHHGPRNRHHGHGRGFGFNPFGGPFQQGYPPYDGPHPKYGPPHRHGPHCKHEPPCDGPECNENCRMVCGDASTSSTTTSTATTTNTDPDIDIRFRDD